MTHHCIICAIPQHKLHCKHIVYCMLYIICNVQWCSSHCEVQIDSLILTDINFSFSLFIFIALWVVLDWIKGIYHQIMNITPTKSFCLVFLLSLPTLRRKGAKTIFFQFVWELEIMISTYFNASRTPLRHKSDSRVYFHPCLLSSSYTNLLQPLKTSTLY